jgi:integrase
MMRRLKAEGRAIRSVAYARSVLRIALKSAKRQGLVTRNVADREYVDPPRARRPEVDVHDAKTVAKILANVETPADRLLLATIASFGLRIGEALGLKWRDLNFTTKTMQIARAVQRREKKGLVFVEVRTSRSRRALLMSDALISDLKKHHRDSSTRASPFLEPHLGRSSRRSGGPLPSLRRPKCIRGRPRDST